MRWMIVLISGVIFLSSQTQANIFFPLSIGYTYGGSGISASFTGIDWNFGTDMGQVEFRPDTKFYFDADDPVRDAPNLVGEMTNAFVPEESLSNTPAWVPTEWFGATQYVRNPLQTETWDLENPDNPDEIIAYEVSEWMLRLYVSVTCEFDKGPAWTPIWNSERENRYRDTELWIGLDLNQNFFIFNGTPTPYFAISKVKCSAFSHGKLGAEDDFFKFDAGPLGDLGTKKPDEYTPTNLFSVVPNSASWMYLYYDQWGQDKALDVDPFRFRGRELNPDIFVDEMFFSVNLANFGTQYDTYLDMSSLTKGDACTWAFDVYVYVVGEWKIKDISELPDEFGRDPMVDYNQSWVSGMLSDPRFQLWSFIGLGALVVCLLAIGAPWVLFGIFGMAKGVSTKK